MMRTVWTVFFIFSIIAVPTVQGYAIQPHQFADSQCRLCHPDVEKNPAHLKPISSFICERCHADSINTLSHPVDIFPANSVPADMPLADGNFSCITCHLVHPFSIHSKKGSSFLLRRPGRGPAFCTACHGVEQKGHVAFENIHQGSYLAADWNYSVDSYTLQCIECHDDKIEISTLPLGAERRRHFPAAGLNHAIGVAYEQVAATKPQEFNPAVVLPNEIRLFNGKIGCGTCHNVYSKKKHMLVMSNSGSRLCLECHTI